MAKGRRFNRRNFLRLSAATATGATLIGCDSSATMSQDVVGDANIKRFVFNRYAQPDFGSTAVHVYADDPVVQLDEGRTFYKTERQLNNLVTKQLDLTTPDPVFGPSLAWAYREFTVHRLSASDAGSGQTGDPLGVAPTQTVDLATRRRQMQTIKLAASPTDSTTPRLCLFNVLVALEWTPDERTLQQLQWAFRRASDFFYDATDGRMAFGQVVFGGHELMDSADIIIMASNRLHPRSWVAGLHYPEKYLAIRMGRGMWHRRNQVSIPWDEPESYRTLIHEWSHYALGLRDEYLSRSDQLGGMVLPGFNMTTTSIMATLEGTSELALHANSDSATNKDHEWERITKFFPWLQQSERVLDGPGPLPLPLPRFQRVGSLKPGQSVNITSSPLRLYPDKAPFASGTQVNLERCWVYVLRQKSDGTPQRLLAQGTLDARSQADGFPLLGAVEGDTILLVHERTDSHADVLQGIVSSGKIMWKAPAQASAAIPTDSLRIAVIPELLDPQPLGGHHIQSLIRIRIQAPTAPPAGSAVWIFPLGQLDSQLLISMGSPTGTEWLSESQIVPTLDGHVLVKWGDQILISAFSQGGGPPFHTGQPANPITAGSSDGNILLFFRDDGWKEDVGPSKIEYTQVKVTTTLLLGTAIAPPDDGQFPLYTYSLGSSAPLPQELTPTVTVFYDPVITTNKGDLQIYRLNEDGKTWTGLETYHEPFSWFAAVPLNMENASKLVDPDFMGPRVEYYRLGKSSKV